MSGSSWESSAAGNRLIFALKLASLALFLKIFAAILWEYRFYFPADFNSNFLAGRELTFRGWYPTAFYAHIITGPIALAISSFLMLSGSRKFYPKWHRWLGKCLVYLTLFVMLPSGLWMATEAFTGRIAGWSFFGLTLATSGSILMAAWHAKSKRFEHHRTWATRSFVLLSSPLLLRLMTGATIVLGLESDRSYQMIVWISWLLPLTILEINRWAKRPLS